MLGIHMDSTPLDPTNVPPRQEFEALLHEIIQHPERKTEVEAKILRIFSVPKAVLVLDLSGFSRTTRQHGIVSFLLMIYQARIVCEPCVKEYRGTLVKAEADNLFCLFDRAEDAVSAAREMLQRLDTANSVLPDKRHIHASIGIGFGETLYVGQEDLFGDEVNLASKLGEDIAEAGEILLTKSAYTSLPAPEEDAAARQVNISGLTLEYWKVRTVVLPV